MRVPRHRERKDPSPAARMVRMIRTLCARGMTRAELEEEFEIDRRHIYDYLQEIEQLGYVFEDYEGGVNESGGLKGAIWALSLNPLRLPNSWPCTWQNPISLI